MLKKRKKTKILKIKLHHKHAHKHPSWLDVFKNFRLHHRIFFYVVSVFGVMMIWKGAWGILDQTPILNHPAASLATGIGLTLATGIFFEIV